VFGTATQLVIRQDANADLQVMHSPLLAAGRNFFWFVSPGGTPPSITGFTLGKPVYRQVWADDFDADTLNRQNWDFEKGFVRNQELQWYQEENAACRNGVLRIEARQEHKPNPGYVAGSHDWRTKEPYIEYTSASMHTSGKQQWLYGRMEMRARIDTASGYWPAWWTLGSNRPWPSNGEIDMMEFYRGKVLANIAVGTPKPFAPVWFSNTWPVRLGGKDWMAAFHTWRMDWDPYGISLYLDGQLLNFQPQHNLYNRDGSGYYPFRHPQYMLLNLAIGGMNGGDPSRSNFPLAYEIDYVKVLQAEDNIYTDTRFFTPDMTR
jgi:beta-glucanase (GH16 family)